MFVMQCKKINNILFKGLLTFKGRASRSEYISKILMLVFLGGLSKDIFYFIDNHNNNLFYILGIIYSFIGILYLIQIIPLNHRRLHDLNCSGWHQLIAFIPFGQLMMIGFIFFKGTEGTNKYGDPPEY